MERLSLPRRNYQALEPGNKTPRSGLKPRPILPKDPLPTWVTLPLDSKFPRIPGPKSNVHLYTTHIGEKRCPKSAEVDFRVTDNGCSSISNVYHPLHDPHLKSHLYSGHVRKLLQERGLITSDGKVICSLREYNEYRQNLRKINRDIDQKKTLTNRLSTDHKGKEDKGRSELGRKESKERVEKKCEHDTHSYRLQRQLVSNEVLYHPKNPEQMENTNTRNKNERDQICVHPYMSNPELASQNKTTEIEHSCSGSHINRVKQAKLRIQSQHDRDVARYQNLVAEDAERRARKHEEQKTALAAKNKRMHETEEHRREIIRRKEEEEMLKKKGMKGRWFMEDEMRKAAAEKRHEQQNIDRERKLIQSWEDRRRIQAITLEEEIRVRNKEEQDKKYRLAQRQRYIEGLRERHKLNFEKMTQHQREEKEKQENACAKRISMRLESCRNKTKSTLHQRPSGTKEKQQQILKSNWDLTELLLQEFSECDDVESPQSYPHSGNYNTDMEAGDSQKVLNNTTRNSEVSLDFLFDADSTSLLRNLVANYISSKVISPASIKFTEELQERQNENHSHEFSIVQKDNQDNMSSSKALEMPPQIHHDRCCKSIEVVIEDDIELVEAVDSSTNLDEKSITTIEQKILIEIMNLLYTIQGRVENGVISAESAESLAATAKEITSDTPQVIFNPLKTKYMVTTTIESEKPVTSSFGKEVIEASVGKLMNDLLEQPSKVYLDNLFQFRIASMNSISDDLKWMTRIITEKSLIMSVGSVLSLIDGIINDRIEEKHNPLRENSCCVSSASRTTDVFIYTPDFIMRIFTKLLHRMQNNVKLSKYPHIKCAEPLIFETRPSSFFYINELFVKSVNSVLDSMDEDPLKFIGDASETDNSYFIVDALHDVIENIQKSKPPSSLSLLIDRTYYNITEPTDYDPCGSVNDIKNIKCRIIPSVASIIIRSIVSKVLDIMENEFLPCSHNNNAVTALFADEIVNAALKRCATLLSMDVFPSRKFTDMIASILNHENCQNHQLKSLITSSSNLQVVEASQPKELEVLKETNEISSAEGLLIKNASENVKCLPTTVVQDLNDQDGKSADYSSPIADASCLQQSIQRKNMVNEQQIVKERSLANNSKLEVQLCPKYNLMFSMTTKSAINVCSIDKFSDSKVNSHINTSEFTTQMACADIVNNEKSDQCTVLHSASNMRKDDTQTPVVSVCLNVRKKPLSACKSVKENNIKKSTTNSTPTLNISKLQGQTTHSRKRSSKRISGRVSRASINPPSTSKHLTKTYYQCGERISSSRSIYARCHPKHVGKQKKRCNVKSESKMWKVPGFKTWTSTAPKKSSSTNPFILHKHLPMHRPNTTTSNVLIATRKLHNRTRSSNPKLTVAMNKLSVKLLK